MSKEYHIDAIGRIRPCRYEIDTSWLDEYKRLKEGGWTNAQIAARFFIEEKSLGMRLTRARKRGDARAIYPYSAPKTNRAMQI